MSEILMCEPVHFGVFYEINSWMNDNVGKVQQEKAKIQWNNLYHKILQHTKVSLIKNPPQNVPDLVFTANAAIVYKKSVLLAHFACPERQLEEDVNKQFFVEKNYQVDSSCIEKNIYFEGAGDCLMHEKSQKVILAYGFRTSQQAFSYVNNFYQQINSKIKIIQVELMNKNFYHLDTCFCPLKNGKILYYPEAFSKDSNMLLEKEFGDELIAVSQEDAYSFACNAVSFQNSIILNKASEKFKRQMNRIKVDVIETSLTEFMLSGGSAKCLTLEINENHFE